MKALNEVFPFGAEPVLLKLREPASVKTYGASAVSARRRHGRQGANASETPPKEPDLRITKCCADSVLCRPLWREVAGEARRTLRNVYSESPKNSFPCPDESAPWHRPKSWKSPSSSNARQCSFEAPFPR